MEGSRSETVLGGLDPDEDSVALRLQVGHGQRGNLAGAQGPGVAEQDHRGVPGSLRATAGR